MSTARTPSQERCILVTGGTGFIAGRFIERALRDPRTRIRALVRDLRRAELLLRWAPERLEVIRGDILDREAVMRAAQGSTHAVHASYGTDGTDADQLRATIEGAANVLGASREHGLRRVVLLSSLAVYDWAEGPCIGEASPLTRTGDAYARGKIEVERLAREEFERFGTPAVVLQPTLVWGPGSRTWTTSFLEALDAGPMPLVDGGEHVCPLVYIDDLADAIELALDTTGVEGKRYLISSGERTTWRELLAGLSRVLGRGTLVDVSAGELRRDARIASRALGLIKSVPRTLRAVQGDIELRRAVRRLPVIEALLRLAPGARRILSLARRRRSGPAAIAEAGQSAGPPAVPPAGPSNRPRSNLSLPPIHPDRLRLYAGDLEVDPALARRELGFDPKFSLERGLERVRLWAERRGLTAPPIPES